MDSITRHLRRLMLSLVFDKTSEWSVSVTYERVWLPRWGNQSRRVNPRKVDPMNAVKIEEAISQLAEQPFDPVNFPYAFLEAFGNKETTIKRLRAGATNKSDLGGVLQTGSIHIATCGAGQVTHTLTGLKKSPATAKSKAKFVLATDGVDFEAE